MPERVRVLFCCNDPDNGAPTDRLFALEVEGLIHLEGDGPFRWDEITRRVSIDGIWYPVRSSRGTWVGNWCWDEALMDTRTVADLMESLRRSGRWDLTGGASDLYDVWESGEEIEEPHLLQALEQQAEGTKDG